MTFRIKANEIISKIIFGSESADSQLNILIKNGSFNQKDLAHIKRIVLGVIENYITYSFYIKEIVDFKKTKSENIIWICIFLYEWLELNKNPALIGNGIIDYIKKQSEKSSKFLNAIFRTLVRIDESEGLENKINKLEEPDKTKIKNSIGDWLFNKLVKHYNVDQINQIAKSWKYNNRFSFWINSEIKDAEEKVKSYNELAHLEQDKTFTFCYWSDKKILDTELVNNNYIYIQDLNSVESVQHLELNEKDKVWDMCSSPGGKLLLISKTVKDNLYATEKNKYRFDRLESNIKNYTSSKINVKNISALDFSETNFDKVLLDAPCTAIGTIYKNKEILLKKMSDSSFQELINLQRELLEKAVNALKIDGILVYSTCSILKEENQDNIKWILNKYSNLELVIEKLYTHDDGPGISGFYISKIIKK